MVTTVAYGLILGHSNTSWKAYEVFFQKDPASFGVSRNRRINTEFFSAHGAASPYFSPMGRVSS
jgi:hypothetical protein